MCEPGGCCSAKSGFRRVNVEALDRLRTAAQSRRPTLLKDTNLKASIVSYESGTALEFISTDKANMQSVMIFQKLGSYGALDLKIETFEVDYPRIKIVLRLSFDPFGGGAFKFDALLTIECQDVSHPAGCTVDFDMAATAKEIQPLFDFECLKRCAPQCISCGADWQCWLGCAGGCILQCL